MDMNLVQYKLIGILLSTYISKYIFWAYKVNGIIGYNLVSVFVIKYKVSWYILDLKII